MHHHVISSKVWILLMMLICFLVKGERIPSARVGRLIVISGFAGFCEPFHRIIPSAPRWLSWWLVRVKYFIDSSWWITFDQNSNFSNVLTFCFRWFPFSQSGDWNTYGKWRSRCWAIRGCRKVEQWKQMRIITELKRSRSQFNYVFLWNGIPSIGAKSKHCWCVAFSHR